MATDTETTRAPGPLDPEAVLRRLEQIGPEERLGAYRGGRLTHAERLLWTAHFPEEVPIVNDEIEWIALGLADLD
jgi:hypothetical protein